MYGYNYSMVNKIVFPLEPLVPFTCKFPTRVYLNFITPLELSFSTTTSSIPNAYLSLSPGVPFAHFSHHTIF